MTDVPPPARVSERANVLAEAQLETLRQLAQIGLDLAGALRTDVVGAAEAVAKERAALEAAAGQDILVPLGPLPALTGDIGLLYSRISRAVRLTLALQTRILRGVERPAREPSEGESPSRRASVRTFEDRDRESTERLIEHDDIEASADLPFADAVAIIRHDLGLPADDPVEPPTALNFPAGASHAGNLLRPLDGLGGLGELGGSSSNFAPHRPP